MGAGTSAGWGAKTRAEKNSEKWRRFVLDYKQVYLVARATFTRTYDTDKYKTESAGVHVNM